MIVLNQKLPLDESTSFVVRTYRTPYFETPWHQHDEIEIAVMKEGKGTCFIGNYIGEFQAGEVYFFGSRLPHWFKKKEADMIAAVLVIQFNVAILGKTFFQLPELEKIRKLLEDSKKGIKLQGELSIQIKKNLAKIEERKGFAQLHNMLECLHLISISGEYELLSEYYALKNSVEHQQKIALVYEYAMNNFKKNITLEEMASLTNQSVSNFCRYFKINTKKTFITFLNEIRISHACKLLKGTNRNISQICFESGFSSWANFSSHFKKIKGMSPRVYRNTFYKNN